MSPVVGVRPPAELSVVMAGTHRTRTPEQTLATLNPMLAQYGVTRVADVTWLDDLGIPVYQAVRPLSRSLALSQGKGITHDLARISAIMETLEGRAAESVPIARARVSARELDLPYDVGLLARPGFEELARGAFVTWSPAVDLRSGQETYLPFDVISLDWCVDDAWAPVIFPSTSNGLASGNTLTEATLHGLLEVIERATEARAEPKEVVDPITIDARYSRQLLDLIDASDSTLSIRFDQNPWGVCVFSASLRNPAFPRFFGGHGAHLDPDVALCRAITEAAQSRATHIAGSRDDMGAGAYQYTHFGPREPLPDPTVSFAEAISTTVLRTCGDIAGDLAAVVAVLHEYPILVTDLSLAPGIHVAKVVVPGLAGPSDG